MKLQEHLITSSSRTFSRKIWVSHPTNLEVKRIALFLDGEIYLDRIHAPELLDDLSLKSTLFVFVSSLNAEARHLDFTCNDAYVDFILEDVIRWVKLHFRLENTNNHLIAGASLSGLAAAYITLRKPSTPFRFALCQSGSFWWNHGWLADQVHNLSASKSRFWVSVGTDETQSDVFHPPTGLKQSISQILACERMVAALSEAGHTVHYNVFNGGHNCSKWKEEFSRAVSWLLNKTEVK